MQCYIEMVENSNFAKPQCKAQKLSESQNHLTSLCLMQKQLLKNLTHLNNVNNGARMVILLSFASALELSRAH